MKIFILTISILITIISVFFFNLKVGHYSKNTNNIFTSVYTSPETKIYLEKLVSLLKKYNVYDKNGPIKLIRLGKDNDGGYVVPEVALKQADVVMGYGISNDISFEEQFSDRYNKKAYGFDCGANVYINIKNKLLSFIPECISTDEFLMNTSSSKKISSFSNQIKTLNLHGKKIFIKMDVEGAEYYSFNDILKHVDNITGIALEIHLFYEDHVKKAVDLLSLLNKYFFLIHVHGNNIIDYLTFVTKNSKGKLTKSLELTYINKSLVLKYEIPKIQSYPLPIDMPSDPSKPDVKFEILID